MSFSRVLISSVCFLLVFHCSVIAQEDNMMLMDDVDVAVPVEPEPTNEEIRKERIITARSVIGGLNSSNRTHFSKDTTYVAYYNTELLDTVSTYRYRCDIEETKIKLINVYRSTLKYSKKDAQKAAERLIQTLPEQACALVAWPVVAEGKRLVQEAEVPRQKSKYKTYFHLDEEGRLVRRINNSNYNNNGWVKIGAYHFFYENGELASEIDSNFLDTWYTSKIELSTVTSKKLHPWGGIKQLQTDEYTKGVKRSKPQRTMVCTFDDQHRLVERVSTDFNGVYTTKVAYFADKIEITTSLKRDYYSKDSELYTFFPVLKK